MKNRAISQCALYTGQQQGWGKRSPGLKHRSDVGVSVRGALVGGGAFQHPFQQFAQMVVGADQQGVEGGGVTAVDQLQTGV